MDILVIIEINNFNTSLLKFIKKYINCNFTFLLIDSDKIKLEQEINSWKINFKYVINDTKNINSIIRNDYHKNYLDLVSLKNIKKILGAYIKLDNLDNTFLLSDFHEKNHLKSKFNNDYIKMKIIDLICKTKKFDKIYFKNIDNFLIVYLKTFYLKKKLQIINLNSFLKFFLYSFIFFKFTFLKSIFYKLLFIIKKIDYSSNFIFQSYYPYLDKKKNSYLLEDQCLYFNKISKLSKKSNLWILHSIKNIGTSKFEFLKYLILCKSNITFLEKEIKFSDYFKLFFLLISNLLISFKITKKISNENNKLNFFIRYGISKSIISKNFVYSLSAYFAYKNIFNKCKFLKKFIYLFENQSWEKAANINKLSTFKTIAYNHTSISSEYLFFYISYLDHNSLAIKQSLPNVIAANSSYSKLQLSKYYSNIDIKEVEALRHNHLKNTHYSENKSIQNIFFLLSIDSYESEIIYNFIYDILNDNRFNSYNIDVKLHPSLKIKMNNIYSNRINIINDNDYNHYLNNSKYIVCGTSSSSIEAIYAGGVILVPNSILTYFKPPIYDFPDMINVFNNIDDFYEKLNSKKDINIDKVNNFKKLYWNINYSLPENFKRIVDE